MDQAAMPAHRAPTRALAMATAGHGCGWRLDGARINRLPGLAGGIHHA